ncbi:MAG: putative rane protein [Myxococcaceae bacterium]|nr:putative rane protein [Myxococcaceae bacterium]
MHRRAIGLPLALVCLAYSGVATAQTAATGALAETLFREGKALMAQGEYAEACPKLAESQRIDPGLGVLLALAYCHDKEGKPATAWSEFVTARGLAERANDADREQVARDYIARLETRLVRMTIRVTPEMQRLPGFELRHNGELLAKATWGMTSPVDLGEQVVEASAPGRQPWSTRFVAREGDAPHAVAVPALASVAAVANASPNTPSETRESHAGRNWGYAVGGLGIASVAVGSIFGLRAIGKNDDAKSMCRPESCASAEGLDLNSEARSSATISTVAIGAGLVAIGVGAVLILTSRSSAPKTHEAALRLVPSAGPDGLGAGMRGAW